MDNFVRGAAPQDIGFITTEPYIFITDYLSSWTSDYPSYAVKLYPFGTSYCDNNATVAQKSSGFNAGINFSIPFYGSRYNTMLVSHTSSIKDPIPMEPYAYGTSSCFTHVLDSIRNDG